MAVVYQRNSDRVGLRGTKRKRAPPCQAKDYIARSLSLTQSVQLIQRSRGADASCSMHAAKSSGVS